jgi:hypothetical protein
VPFQAQSPVCIVCGGITTNNGTEFVQLREDEEIKCTILRSYFSFINCHSFSGGMFFKAGKPRPESIRDKAFPNEVKMEKNK